MHLLVMTEAYIHYEIAMSYCPYMNSDERPTCRFRIRSVAGHHGVKLRPWNTHIHTHIPQYKSLDWNECSNAMSLEATQGVILVWGGGKQAAECLSAGGRKRSSLCTSKALAWKVNSRASVLNM